MRGWLRLWVPRAGARKAALEDTGWPLEEARWFRFTLDVDGLTSKSTVQLRFDDATLKGTLSAAQIHAPRF